MELQQRQTEQEKLLAQRDDVSSQLQEVNHANSRLLEQVTELGQEKDKLQQELEETRKTADKRQAMLDELAIDVAQEKSRHKEELSEPAAAAREGEWKWQRSGTLCLSVYGGACDLDRAGAAVAGDAAVAKSVHGDFTLSV
ncbi:hypothetical protein AAFF_G00186650 [Aldrovandia affinis]|uniref:Uncharacterized protein n=1 Tax=Aldrovandia affinis TaxID=143900 RepID=A0AAD7SXW8_9TELE|nr:hypothetical protein AAFF_G00186650 [Aldrovandia affinis]